MKLLIHFVLWIGWLLLAYFVGASIVLLQSEAEVGQVDNVLRVALFITAVVGAIFGLLAAHVKKHLFWIRKKLTIEDGGGRAIFLGFSMAAITGGGLAAVALFAPRLIWGETVMPMMGAAVGILFLVVLFPRLPR